MKIAPLINHNSCPEAKIALFRSLFRGREDVHSRRFENRKTGKSGYTVLRFLTEDVGKCLDEVLDIILRSLARQNKDSDLIQWSTSKKCLPVQT